ncbi:MAG: putative porin [Bacteroidales bacterium]
MKIKVYSLILGLILLSLLTNGQIDSLEYRNIYNWKINPYDLSLEYEETDTLLEGFQRYNQLLDNTITTTYLGNLGTPTESNIYYDRVKYKTDFVFSEPYAIYFHHPKDQLYFNTKKRFTLLNYSNAGPKNESEQLLGVLHTQNITPDFNIGIDYNMISSNGRYQEQQVRQNIIKLFSSFHTDRYRAHLNFYLNRNKSQLNGGIDSLNYLGSDEYSNRLNIPVKLSNARNQNLSSGLYLAHEYHFGKKEIIYKEKNDSTNALNLNDKNLSDSSLYKGSKNINGNDTSIVESKETKLNLSGKTGINNKNRNDKGNEEQQQGTVDTVEVFKYSGFSLSHELYYNNDVRKFFDDDLTEPFYSDLDIFIDSTKTHDEVRQKRFANSLSLHYRYKNFFSSRLSLYNEQMQYQYNVLPDTTFTDIPASSNQDTIIKTNKESLKNNNRFSLFIKGFVFDQFLFNGKIDYYFTGYKKDNSLIKLKLAYLYNDFEIAFNGNYTNQRPDFFYSEFSSNHFKWNNDLRMKEEWDVDFTIQSLKYRFKSTIRYGQISNYLYFDSTAYLNQYKDQINILFVDFSKKITLGPIHSNSRFVYQKSFNNKILALPEFNLYQSLYYEKLLHFKTTGGKLLVQIGVDYRYASSFYADGFMPPTGMFYRQFEHKMGEFHRFDVFANFTLKRTRFYFQYSYLNSALNENYYYNAPFYPSPQPVFKYGIAWSFYD